MLHIVQVVFAGMAETPKVFLEPEGAESAFVEQVKKCWKQSYSAYCDQNGVGMDSFASAKAFLETLDLSEKNRINCWVVNPEDAGLDRTKQLKWIEQRRDTIDNLVKRVERSSAAVREGLTGLQDDLAQLRDCFDDIEGLPAEVEPAGPKGDAALSPPVPEQEEPAETYATKEWKIYAGTIMNMYGGSRSEFPLLSRYDWRQDVYSNATSLEYWDWVAAIIKKYREKAEKADYTVIKDADSPGHYKISTPQGAVEETSYYSEWEAWCHAGMDLP
jgi:hypothetical protein